MRKVGSNATSDSALTANKMATELRNDNTSICVYSRPAVLKHQVIHLTKYSMSLLNNLILK